VNIKCDFCLNESENIGRYQSVVYCNSPECVAKAEKIAEIINNEQSELGIIESEKKIDELRSFTADILSDTGSTKLEEKLALMLEIAIEALDLISKSEYVNDYDLNRKFIGTRYPQDIAKECLKEINEVCK